MAVCMGEKEFLKLANETQLFMSAWSLVSQIQESIPLSELFLSLQSFPPFSLQNCVRYREGLCVSWPLGRMASSCDGPVLLSAPALASSELHIIPPCCPASCWHLQDVEVCS